MNAKKLMLLSVVFSSLGQVGFCAVLDLSGEYERGKEMFATYEDRVIFSRDPLDRVSSIAERLLP